MTKGDSFECYYSVSTRVRDLFIELFEDRNPLHTESVFAREKGFEDRVIHGNILNGFVSHFVGECLPVKNVIIHAQELKFLKPVYNGDELQLKAKIHEVYESVRTIVFSLSFSNQKGEQVAKGKVQIGLI
jgi:3-hydroxybutyryl-CoA dehydratase